MFTSPTTTNGPRSIAVRLPAFDKLGLHSEAGFDSYRVLALAALLVSSSSAQCGAIYGAGLRQMWGGYPGMYSDLSAAAAATSSDSPGGATASASGASGAGLIPYGGVYNVYSGGLIGSYPRIHGDYRVVAAADTSAAFSGGDTSSAASSGASGINGRGYGLGLRYGGYCGGGLIRDYPGICGDTRATSTAAAESGSSSYVDASSSTAAASGAPSSGIIPYKRIHYGICGGGAIGGYPGIYGDSNTAAATSSASSEGAASSASGASDAGLIPYGGIYGVYGNRLIGGYPGIYGDSSATAAAATGAASSGVYDSTAAAAASEASSSGVAPYGRLYGLYGGGLIGGYPVIYGDSSATAASAASSSEEASSDTTAAKSEAGFSASGGGYGLGLGCGELYGGGLIGSGLIGGYPNIWSVNGDSSTAAVATSAASSGESASSAAASAES
uniref:Uncharacterized protein n=1 Tax=Timema shepardi TaxID=629360 RepID=A0A7R9AV55_TIMSH|nr:unnamed protein product [Timema shepardi]